MYSLNKTDRIRVSTFAKNMNAIGKPDPYIFRTELNVDNVSDEEQHLIEDMLDTIEHDHSVEVDTEHPAEFKIKVGGETLMSSSPLACQLLKSIAEFNEKTLMDAGISYEEAHSFSESVFRFIEQYKSTH